MPLRDHFRPPVSKRSSWEGFHGGWPYAMCQQLAPLLPDGFVAEPRVHLGTFYEIDVCTFEDYSDPPSGDPPEPQPAAGGTATATTVIPAPSLAVDTEFAVEYAYEVLVFDLERERELVAAIEIVSPANKDRPDSRQIFAAKCANLLTKGVCVSIVDLVTTRHFNLYLDLLTLKGRKDPVFEPDAPWTYAATCRRATVSGRTQLQTWAYPLVLGQPLPRLPIWIGPARSIMLDLEASYEDACRTLKIR